MIAPRRGQGRDGRDNQPQVIIALAATRYGMPVRSWVPPGDTADVATAARIEDDLSAWRLGRCVFIGDAGMYSAEKGRPRLDAANQGGGEIRRQFVVVTNDDTPTAEDVALGYKGGRIVEF